MLDYTTYTINLNMNYLIMCKVTTDVGGLIKVIPWLSTCMGDNHLLKLGDYLNEEEDKPWYNYYLMYKIKKKDVIKSFPAHLNKVLLLRIAQKSTQHPLLHLCPLWHWSEIFLLKLTKK